MKHPFFPVVARATGRCRLSSGPTRPAMIAGRKDLVVSILGSSPTRSSIPSRIGTGASSPSIFDASVVPRAHCNSRPFSAAPATIANQGIQADKRRSNSINDANTKTRAHKHLNGSIKPVPLPPNQETTESPNPDTASKNEHERDYKRERKTTAYTQQMTSTTEQPPTIDFGDISRAMVAIKSGIRRTECIQSFFLSELCGANIYLKPEVRQFTGSFKERGARNAILALLAAEAEAPSSSSSPARRTAGVVAASAGNHALALAYHGKQLGVPVTVVMPTVAPLLKVDRCRQFGATVLVEGAHLGESKIVAEELAAQNNLTYVNGYDDPAIVAGAGTLGMEIVEDVPYVDVVVVPVGGAGLIAGVSCAVKTLKPVGCTVIGVEPERCASYTAALAAGHPVDISAASSSNSNINSNISSLTTLADGLAVSEVGARAFALARKHVDECVLVNEKAISLAVLRLIENEKMVVEGGGATGLAALLPGGPLFGRPDIAGKTVVVPLCGGNIDTAVLGRVLERGLAADHRLCNFTAEVSDRPGGIARLTEVLSQEGASIKDIYHERAWLHTSVDRVRVRCVVELHGKDHAERLERALVQHGYPSIDWNQPPARC